MTTRHLHTWPAYSLACALPCLLFSGMLNPQAWIDVTTAPLAGGLPNTPTRPGKAQVQVQHQTHKLLWQSWRVHILDLTAHAQVL
jgi:hypothetical protein